jgi:hypothetical protein
MKRPSLRGSIERMCGDVPRWLAEFRGDGIETQWVLAEKGVRVREFRKI